MSLSIIPIVLLFLVLFLSGMNIASILLVTGTIGIYVFGDISVLSNVLQSDVFSTVAGYTLTTIPLFILMSQFFIQSEIVKDMYTIMYNVSRGNSSLLGGSTVVLGGILGSVSGSGTASSAALGNVSVPELQKHGYKDNLAGAIAASGGALSGIIPPSIILILYGSTTETGINKLFIGALIPGLILTMIFVVLVLITHRLNQRKLDADVNATFKKRYISTKRLVITVLASLTVLMIIFFGIYLGVFTATEAGAIGAFVSMLATFALGRLNLKIITKSLVETIKVSGMVMFIMVGASIFARFITLSMLPNKLISLLAPMIDNKLLILVALISLYFLLFMILEGAAVIVMTVPITLPIILAADIDLIWFGVIVGITSTIGLMTPPVGLSVFAVAGASGLRIENIFRVTLVFSIIASVIIITLLVLFPELVTWLPSTMN